MNDTQNILTVAEHISNAIKTLSESRAEIGSNNLSVRAAAIAQTKLEEAEMWLGKLLDSGYQQVLSSWIYRSCYPQGLLHGKAT
jgi:hypothetical protein